MAQARSATEPERQRSSYRGADRRAEAATGVGIAERSWVAAGLMLGAVILVSVGLVLFQRLGPMPASATIGLRSAAVVLAAVLAVVAWLHWRVTGLVRGARLSVAAWLLTAVGITQLVVDSQPTGGSLHWLAVALSVSAAAWVVWGLLGPEVDASVRPHVEFGLALGAAILVWGLLWVATPSPVSGRAGTVLGLAALVAGMVWAAVAIVALVHAVAQASLLMGWMAWLAVGVSAAELARFGAWLHTPEWLGLTASASVLGLLVATLGVAGSLGRSAIDRRGQLHAASIYERAREHAADGRDRERAHEIRNALFAIEGATQALERYGDRLSPTDRADLSLAVTRGIAHLRDLVDPRPEERTRLYLSELVASRAALVRARGIPVQVEGDEDAVAVADEVMCSQIVDNLLANAVRHGDAAITGVEVRVEQDGEQVRVVVSDGGPGIPAEESERIFDTGVRLAEEREGEGLGLPLARALAQRQGGDLVLDLGGEGQGARFVLSLPGAGAMAGVGQGPDGLEDVGERGQVPGGTTADAQLPAAEGGRLVVEHDDDLGVHVEGVGVTIATWKRSVVGPVSRVTSTPEGTSDARESASSAGVAAMASRSRGCVVMLHATTDLTNATSSIRGKRRWPIGSRWSRIMV
jgi:signal transduction histidine kinase